MIKNRAEACMKMGLSIAATEADIRSAFKTLVKIYHPDSADGGDAAKYNEIVEAYEYLCPKSGTKSAAKQGNQQRPSYSKVVGGNLRRSTPTGGVNGGKQFRNTASRSDYESFQKKMKKQQEQKKADFEKKTKEYSAKIAKQEADYKRAMNAIDAIRIARAIEGMVWANGLEKDGKINKE